MLPGYGEPISATFSPREQTETLASARAFLNDLDYDSINRDDAIQAWQATEADVRPQRP